MNKPSPADTLLDARIFSVMVFREDGRYLLTAGRSEAADLPRALETLRASHPADEFLVDPELEQAWGE